MAINFNNLEQETKWVEIADISTLSWKQTRQSEKVKKFLTTLENTPDLNDENKAAIRSLQEKVATFEALLLTYKPTVCQIIWQIISLSFTYFKVKRLQKTITKINQINQRILLNNPAPDAPVDLKIIQRKITIVKKVLEYLDCNDYQHIAYAVNQSVRRFFKDKHERLQKGANVMIGGGFYHCTDTLGNFKEAVNQVLEGPNTLGGLAGILVSKTLYPGHTNAYGLGVYTSTIPQWDPLAFYGKYCFAICEHIDETKDHYHMKDIQLVTQYNNRIWAVFRGTISLRPDTAILSVPDTEVDDIRKEYEDVQKILNSQPIEILSRSELDFVITLKTRAEDELKMAHLPKKSLWHIGNRSMIPKRFESFTDKIKECTFTPGYNSMD